MTDGGSAMIAEEFREGLLNLGIVHETTLPYSPYQNGKQERFWATLEGRLMEMLAGVKELTLELVDHAAGNYRLLMTISGELLAYGMAQEVTQLDEKCFLEVFQPAGPRPTGKKKARV